MICIRFLNVVDVLCRMKNAFVFLLWFVLFYTLIYQNEISSHLDRSLEVKYLLYF